MIGKHGSRASGWYSCSRGHRRSQAKFSRPVVDGYAVDQKKFTHPDPQARIITMVKCFVVRRSAPIDAVGDRRVSWQNERGLYLSFRSELPSLVSNLSVNCDAPFIRPTASINFRSS